jgi:glycosyltransferase involved in cell wall biosynthesis
MINICIKLLMEILFIKKKKFLIKIYIYLFEKVISNFYNIQYFIFFKNKFSLDFLFKLNDLIFFKSVYKKKYHIKKNELCINIFVKLNEKRSKYIVPLKSFPYWITKRKLNKLKKNVSNIYKTSKKKLSSNQIKIPVQFLPDNKVKSFSSFKKSFGLSLLSPYSFYLGEKIEKNDKIKNYKYSIIIPYRDQIKSTLKCIKKIIEKSSGKLKIELILINNQSEHNYQLITNVNYLLKNKNFIKVQYLNYPYKFSFSSMINLGVKKASYDFVISCNNDVYIETKGWDLKLNSATNLHPNNVWGIILLNKNKIDSLGIFFRHNMQPINLFEYQDCRLLKFIKKPKYDIMNVDAVSGAFLCANKKVFYESGKFDEKLKISLNDVAFCVNANSLKYNSATLMNIHANHHRSLSRVHDLHKSQKKRYFREINHFRRIVLKSSFNLKKSINNYSSIPMRGLNCL